MLGSMHGIVLLCFMPLFSRNDHHILKETQFQFKTVCLVIMVLCLIVGCGTRTGKAHTHREKVRLFHLESKKDRFQPLKSFFGNAEGHEVAGLSHNQTAAR